MWGSVPGWMDRRSFLATATVRPRQAVQFWRLWITVKMWIRCGWVLRGRLSAGRIQARRTRAVFEREPVALQLGDSQVGRSLRMDVAYVRQLESPWTWPEQELSNCNPGSRARVVHSGPGRDRLRSGRRSDASPVVRVSDARREATRTGRSGRGDHQAAGQGQRCRHGRDLDKGDAATREHRTTPLRGRGRPDGEQGRVRPARQQQPDSPRSFANRVFAWSEHLATLGVVAGNHAAPLAAQGDQRRSPRACPRRRRLPSMNPRRSSSLGGTMRDAGSNFSATPWRLSYRMSANTLFP